VVPVEVPPLIDRQTFDTVQAHLKARNPERSTPGPRDLRSHPPYRHLLLCRLRRRDDAEDWQGRRR